MSDIDLLADAREWLATQGDRVQTHSEICHRWHPACLVSRLLAELSRAGQIGAKAGDSDADHPERERGGRITREAYEGDILSRLRNWRGLHLAHGGRLFEESADEIERLRIAIRRLAEQDATLSVVGGNVTVTMDGTLTDAEYLALAQARDAYAANSDDEECVEIAAVIRSLLERTSPDRIGNATKNVEPPICDGPTLDGGNR